MTLTFFIVTTLDINARKIVLIQTPVLMILGWLCCCYHFQILAGHIQNFHNGVLEVSASYC